MELHISGVTTGFFNRKVEYADAGHISTLGRVYLPGGLVASVRLLLYSRGKVEIGPPPLPACIGTFIKSPKLSYLYSIIDGNIYTYRRDLCYLINVNNVGIFAFEYV